MTFSLRQWGILLAVTTTLSILLMDNNAVPIILPTIQNYFSMDVTTASWVLNSNYLGLAALILIGGRASDIWSRKRVFLVSSAVYCLVSVLTSLAPSKILMLCFRGCQGGTMAFMLPSALSIMIHSFSINQRGRAWGYSISIGSIVMLLGPFFAGCAVQYLSWRYLFLLTPIISLVGIVLAAIFVESHEVQKGRKFDVQGAFYLACALILFTFTIMQSGSWGIFTFKTLLFLLLSVLLGQMSFYSNKERNEHIIDFGLWKNKCFCRCLLVVVAIQFIMPLPIYWIKYLQEGLGFSPLFVGKLMGFSIMPSIVLSPCAGYLSDRYNPRVPTFIGFLCIPICVFLFSSFLHSMSNQVLLAAFTFFSIGNAFIMTPLGTTTLSHPSPSSRGAAAGLYNTVRFLSFSLGLAIFTLIDTLGYKTGQNSAEHLQKIVIFDQRYVFFMAIIGACLTLVHLKSYNEIKESV